MPKRILEGVVVSDKGDKTVVVKVERTFLHPVLKKTVRRSKKYHAHDEANEFKAGEQIRIEECAPISKLKTWKALDRIGAAKVEAVEIVEGASNPVEEKKAPAKAKAEKPAAKAKKAKAEDVADADA